MKYITMCLVFTILGWFIGTENKQGVFKEYKKIDKVFKSLEKLIEDYTWVAILISFIISVGMVEAEVIKCAGLDDETPTTINMKPKVSFTGKVSDISLKPIAFTAGTLGTLKLGIQFYKSLPTLGGKLLGIGYITTMGTASMYILNKDNRYKNEEINEVIEKGVGIKEVIDKGDGIKEVIEKGVGIKEVIEKGEEITELINKITGNEEEVMESIMTIFHLNSFVMIGQVLLLNSFLVLVLKGKEGMIVKYIPFIKRKEKLEDWLKWYINKKVGFTSFMFIMIWISAFVFSWLIKYVIIVELLS